jgi:hypothetical protein
MKKLVVSLISVLVLSTVSFAQSRDTGLFVGAQAGMNMGLNGKPFVDRVNSNFGAGVCGDFYAGYWFTSLLGVRAGYQGFSISDTYVDFGYDTYSYIHADALFRVYHSVIPYVHLGAVGVNNWSIGGGVGIMFPVAISKWVSLVPDFKATAFTPSVFAVSGISPAFALSASLGLVVNLDFLFK